MREIWIKRNRREMRHREEEKKYGKIGNMIGSIQVLEHLLQHQAIQSSVELENEASAISIGETLRLLHVHFMVEFPIQKHVADV